MDVDVLAFEWGRAADLAAVAEKLRTSGKQYKAVTVTHNETSTAVTNETKAIAALVREHGALLIVDCISGMLCTDFETDAWGCDVVVAGSQKAFMLPPGLAFVSVSERAKEAMVQSKCPKFYFDLAAMLESGTKRQTAYTPAVGLFFGLETAMELILKEGVDAVIARHKRLAEGVRAGVKATGLKFFMDEAHASNALTAILPPDGVDADKLRSLLSRKHSIVLSGGQGKLKGQIFRISHMGAVSERELLGALCALEMGLREMGYACDVGAAAHAAANVWMA
jgi:aspartate aminotransferase-like enzyme